MGQLLLARDELGNVSGGGEWTDSLHLNGTSFFANQVGAAGVESTISIANARIYRCVTPLVR